MQGPVNENAQIAAHQISVRPRYRLTYIARTVVERRVQMLTVACSDVAGGL